jgi:hypothetical protein
MQPWEAEHIEWDEGNMTEVVRHGLSPLAVNEAINNSEVWRPNERGKSGNWKGYGRTDNDVPVTFVILFDEVRSSIRPITAWKSSSADIARFF